MLRRGLQTAYYYKLMHIVYFLEDADQWQSHSLVWRRFICTICMIEVGVHWSIVVLTIAEHAA